MKSLWFFWLLVRIWRLWSVSHIFFFLNRWWKNLSQSELTGGSIVLYWPALSIEVFVSLLTVNVQISITWPLAFYLQRAERWRRAQNVFEIYNKNRAEFPQAGAWIDFGPCGRWSDSQHRHCSVCTVNMTSLLRYGAVAAKWNTHPHLCGDLIRLYRLCLCTFSTNRTVLSGGELRSVSAKG